MSATLTASRITPGHTILDAGNRFTVRTVDCYTKVRNGSEFARPSPGKLWWGSGQGSYWIVDEGSEWLVANP